MVKWINSSFKVVTPGSNPLLLLFSFYLGGGVGAVVRSLPSNPKVPGSIPGSAESGIFGDLLSR